MRMLASRASVNSRNVASASGLSFWMSFGKIASKKRSSDASGHPHVQIHVRNAHLPTDDHSTRRSTLADGHFDRWSTVLSDDWDAADKWSEWPSTMPSARTDHQVEWRTTWHLTDACGGPRTSDTSNEHPNVGQP
jgi:hypothetical protein